MNIVSDKKEMVFVKDYNGKKLYSLGLSKKNQDGTYTKGYISCRFKNGTELKTQTLIKINNAWLDFYLKDKATVPYIFINEFEVVEEKSDIEENKEVKRDPYEEMGDLLEIDDLDLPFGDD